MRIYVNLLRGWVVFNVFVAIDTRGFRLPGVLGVRPPPDFRT